MAVTSSENVNIVGPWKAGSSFQVLIEEEIPVGGKVSVLGRLQGRQLM
jgi:hypothetical protein